VSIAASRKQIELQQQQLQNSVDHLNDQAKAALGQGKEDLAREALSRKAAAQQQIQTLEPQRQELAEHEQKMEQTLSALQQRVNQSGGGVLRLEHFLLGSPTCRRGPAPWMS
jgi:phage shock protein A